MDSEISDTPDTAVPALESVIRIFIDNGSTKAEAQKYYNYYTLRDWMTAKGELITDVEESVKRWIDRNARFWSRKSGRSQGKSGNNRNRTPYTYPVNNPVPESDQPGNSSTPSSPATPYWDGNCASPSNVKPGSFRDFEQRNYDYDALMKLINPLAM
ncbi:MAG: hypothetical protein SOW08_05675 [Lachnospiraceae bacterium]|nr:hypothetical protein [Lachnospiraceae bacterium]